MRHLLDLLEPLSVERGGPLVIRHITYVEANLLFSAPLSAPLSADPRARRRGGAT